jgi:hypothetical protein
MRSLKAQLSPPHPLAALNRATAGQVVMCQQGDTVANEVFPKPPHHFQERPAGRVKARATTRDPDLQRER